MTVLAILQNQWFKDPEKVREILGRHDKAFRLNFIRRSLFAGCATGRALRSGLGREWCDHIIWEEASPEVGGHASSVFKADLAHIRKAILEIKPSVILVFGKVAQRAIFQLMPMPEVPAVIIDCPHPTARGTDIRSALAAVRVALNQYA